MSRQAALDAIKRQPEVSVLIVGAGINGIGIFRELALQGVDVLLIDRADFCAGASAGSSHMLHGGIRYLENGEFRLVREALIERNRMLLNAPHYAKPLPTTIPIFSWLSGIFNAPLKFLNLRDKPSERGALVIKIGLILYDWFTRSLRVTPTHRFQSKAESLRLRPHLNPDIINTATYYDAWMPYPERICMELIMDTEATASNARALNYVSLHGAAGDRVTLRDELTGETFTVKPRVVVNAAGPWIDFANAVLGQKTRFIGGTKGSHLIIDHPDLRRETLGHEIFFENKDGRICLILPFLDKLMLGTTDIRINNPDQAQCTDEEIDYMLELVGRVFPGFTIDRSHIVFWFTGVRPLPASDASRTGAISRDHSIKITEPGPGISFPVYSLVGGKWTTFRAFAEQTADKVLERLHLPRKVDTVNLPIGGGKDYPTSEADQRQWLVNLQKTGLSAERARTLFERYGTYAQAVAAFITAAPDAPLITLPDYSRREIMFLAKNEKVVHLDDLLLRRSLIAMLGLVTGAVLRELSDVVAEALGWSDEHKRQEIERAADILHTKHGVKPEKLTVSPEIQSK